LKTLSVSPHQMEKQNDWRPAVYLSGGAVLRGIGSSWLTLEGLAETCIEGWRVSRNPAAASYDPMVKTTPVYRLRNIQPYWIETEPDHLRPPKLAGQPFCVESLDIIIRKVGASCAALVTPSHGQHPVDANLGIIRGLSLAEAVWVCFCLNQPLYQDYLESDSIGALIRLGLKKIKEMPICPVPDAVRELAPLYMGAYIRLVDAQQMLASVRYQVKEWIVTQLSGFDTLHETYSKKCRGQFFNSRYLGDSLHIHQVEQEYLRVQLIEQYGFKPITEFAVINPVNGERIFAKKSKVLQIANISEHLSLKFPLPERTPEIWRTQNRALCQYDVLVSTFAENARVAYMDRQPQKLIYPSCQIAALRFRKYPGAYALLMESRLVRMQLERLAFSGGFRFIPFRQLDKIVLPDPDQATLKFWHEKVVAHHEKSRHAESQLEMILQQMVPIFNGAHRNSPSTFNRFTGKGGCST